MLPPHIVEREDRKRLDLLAFAMDRAGVDRRHWAAAYDRADIGPVDDCTCLYHENGWWVVSYTERGIWTEIGRFPLCYTATNYLFGEFCRGKSLYDVREAWESSRGLSFSMVD
jgi:hypothetical protein